MICPQCGKENPDKAPECSQCRYKFQFGHAYNDPAHMAMPETSKNPRNKKQSSMRAVLYILGALAMIFAIVMSFLSARQ